MTHWLWYTLPLVAFPGLEQALGGPVPPVCPLPVPGRVMAVAAHPDDLEYFCGGTLRGFSMAGSSVTAVLATRGERGGPAEVREQEQESASRILGFSRLVWLGLPDRGVKQHRHRLLDALGRLLEEERPDLVLTFDPVYPFPVYQHADHMAVAEAILSEWTGPALLFHTRRPSVAFDITSEFPAKISAFLAHSSQLPRRGTARLVGWHLGMRTRREGRLLLELFRAQGAPLGG